MADKNYDIKISTEADTKGLKEVEKELDTSKKKFEELGTAGAGAGAKTSGGLKKLFPTFSKLGGALGGLMGSMGSFLNPVTIAITATTAAIGYGVKKYKEWSAGIDRAAKFAATAIQTVKSTLDSYIEREREATQAVAAFADAQERAARATRDRTEAVKQQERDQLALTDANLALELSEIDLAEAQGKLTPEAADQARLTARRGAEDRQRDITRDSLAAQRDITAAEAATDKQTLIDALAKRAAAQDALNRFERAGGHRARAESIDPALNTNLDQARRDERRALAAADQDPSEENTAAAKEASKARLAADEARLKAIKAQQKLLAKDIDALNAGVHRAAKQSSDSDRQRRGAETALRTHDTVGAETFDLRRRAEDNTLQARRIADAKQVQPPAAANPPPPAAIPERLVGVASAYAGARPGTTTSATHAALTKLAEDAARPGGEERELQEVVSLFRSLAGTQRKASEAQKEAYAELKKIVVEMQNQLANNAGLRE